MKIFNISLGIKNRLQMLTKRRPKAECNTTSATMGCIYTGHKIPTPDGILPEDYLMGILDSPEGRAYLQKVCPGAEYNPWNDSDCIAWAVNKAVGKDVCRVVKATLDEILTHVANGGAAVVGGGFIAGVGTFGHFVCVVGHKTDDNNKVTEIIYDDPLKGNDMALTVAKFVKLTFGKSKRKTVQLYSRAA